jgi:hypothetical protein
LSSNLCIGLPRGVFLSSFLTNISVCISHLSHAHIFKQFISYFYIIILSCIQVIRHENILSPLCIYFRPNYLLVSNGASVFLCFRPINCHHQHACIRKISHPHKSKGRFIVLVHFNLYVFW